MQDNSRPVRVGLALSGGGARGFAHVGVIQELERLRVPLFCVAGTSMGSLVGGWYCAKGNVDSLMDVFRTHPWRSFFEVKHVPHNLGSGGLFDMAKVEKEMRSYLGAVDIENLPLKFMTPATSLKNGTEVDFSSGDLVDAICASGSLPFVFLPRKHDDDYLSDGGLLNNLPIDLCFKMGADVVLAVDVGHEFTDFNLINSDGNVSFKPWEVYRVADALISMVGQKNKKYDPQDSRIMIIKPYVTYIATTEFDRMDDAVFAGRKAVQEQEQAICEFTQVARPSKGFWDKVADFLKE